MLNAELNGLIWKVCLTLALILPLPMGEGINLCPSGFICG
jgi:hypothetical protein